MRGVSAVIAVILLLMITVALAATSYVWFSSVTETVMTGGTNVTERATASILSDFRIESSTPGAIYVRNIGSTALSGWVVYVNDNPTTIKAVPDTLPPGAIGTLFFYSYTGTGQNTIRVTTAQGATQTTTNNVLFYANFEADAVGQPPSNWTGEVNGGVRIVDDSANIPPELFGNKSAYFPGDGLYRRLRSNAAIPVKPGQIINGSVYYRGTAASGGKLWLGLFYGGMLYQYNYFVPCTNIDGNASYAKCSGSLTVPSNVNSANVWILNYYGNDALYTRDITIWID
ncbi:MAG: archaellin/type IV pilin N-terminal domain-containing protein [Candidatus Aenigmatarchaeota archaeon]